jgi:hypothetical protein
MLEYFDIQQLLGARQTHTNGHVKEDMKCPSSMSLDVA